MARVSQGIGAITTIMSILDELSLGHFCFEMGIMLQNSLLLNKSLVNSEIWYGLFEKQSGELETVDKFFYEELLGHTVKPQLNSFIWRWGVSL